MRPASRTSTIPTECPKPTHQGVAKSDMDLRARRNSLKNSTSSHDPAGNRATSTMGQCTAYALRSFQILDVIPRNDKTQDVRPTNAAKRALTEWREFIQLQISVM